MVQNKAYEVLFIFLNEVNILNNIGDYLKFARESSSVSIEEASKDTNIPVEALEQIEEGSIGSFKDIFKLKEYLQVYAKYLGLDPVKIIDNFNEYMFEYTSKIPLDDLAKEMQIQEREKEKVLETNDIKVITPYLKEKKVNHLWSYLLIAGVVLILAIVTIIWAIEQVM